MSLLFAVVAAAGSVAGIMRMVRSLWERIGLLLRVIIVCRAVVSFSFLTLASFASGATGTGSNLGGLWLMCLQCVYFRRTTDNIKTKEILLCAFNKQRMTSTKFVCQDTLRWLLNVVQSSALHLGRVLVVILVWHGNGIFLPKSNLFCL